MTPTIQTLRLFLHLPDGTRRGIAYPSRFGDVMRVSFDASYVDDPGRPTLSLSFRGASEAETRQILGSARDARLARSDGRWPVLRWASVFARTGVPPAEYAVNRRVDAAMRALDLDGLRAILREADVPRVSRLVAVVRETVAMARARWPAVLVDAPDAVRASVTERLGGGVALAR